MILFLVQFCRMSGSGRRQSRSTDTSSAFRILIQDFEKAQSDLLRSFGTQHSRPIIPRHSISLTLSGSTRINVRSGNMTISSSTSHRYGSGRVQTRAASTANQTRAVPTVNQTRAASTANPTRAVPTTNPTRAVPPGPRTTSMPTPLSRPIAIPMSHSMSAAGNLLVVTRFDPVTTLPRTNDTLIEVDITSADEADDNDDIFADSDDEIISSTDEDSINESDDDDMSDNYNDDLFADIDFLALWGHQTQKVSTEVIEKNTIKYKYVRSKKRSADEHNPELDKCPICISDFKNGEDVRRLRCLHAFHVDCVDEWICNRQQSCPVCRTKAIQIN